MRRITHSRRAYHRDEGSWQGKLGSRVISLVGNCGLDTVAESLCVCPAGTIISEAVSKTSASISPRL